MFKSIAENKSFSWKCTTCINKEALSPITNIQSLSNLSESDSTLGNKIISPLLSRSHQEKCSFCNEVVNISFNTLMCNLCHVIKHCYYRNSNKSLLMCTYLSQNSCGTKLLHICCQHALNSRMKLGVQNQSTQKILICNQLLWN